MHVSSNIIVYIRSDITVFTNLIKGVNAYASQIVYLFNIVQKSTCLGELKLQAGMRLVSYNYLSP